jgi:hypothetical protein
MCVTVYEKYILLQDPAAYHFLSNVTDSPSYTQHYLKILNLFFFKVFLYMFRHIWPSSCIKTLVVPKLLLICSYFLCGPTHVLVYPSVTSRWSCVTLTVHQFISSLILFISMIFKDLILTSQKT